MNFGFFVNATNSTGIGHYKRSIRIALRLQKLGLKIYWFGSVLPSINIELKKNNIRNKKIKIDNLEEVKKKIKEHNLNGLLFDSYLISSDFLKQLYKFSSPTILLVIIEDYPRFKYFCDILIDHNLVPKFINSKYKRLCNRECQLLLGGNFSLIGEKSKTQLPKYISSIPTNRKHILISMGGSSKLNNFSKLLTKKLIAKDRVLCTVLNGLKNNKFVSDGELYLGYQKTLDPLYNWADVIVGGGGVSCYERIAFKKPSLVFILSEDQRLQSEYIAQKGGHLLMKDGLDLKNLNLEINKLLKIKDFKLKNELKVSRNGVKLVSNLIYKRIMSL